MTITTAINRRPCSMKNSNGIPEHGRIDLHSHLLPGIDDGCTSLAESLACIERLMERGFVGTVCTPHHFPQVYPDNTPVNVERAVERLADELRQRGIDYALWAGGELRIDDAAIPWLEQVGVPTLGHSRTVLIDYFGTEWPAAGDRLCRYLIEHGYQPILAHPERLDFTEPDLARLLASLEERGVWLQSNFNSMTGGEGARAAERVRRFIAADRLHAMAMDLHRPDTLEGRLQGMALVEAEAGAARLARLLEEGPRTILVEGCFVG
jgi:protein-tyrosine phosphatase